MPLRDASPASRGKRRVAGRSLPLPLPRRPAGEKFPHKSAIPGPLSVQDRTHRLDTRYRAGRPLCRMKYTPKGGEPSKFRRFPRSPSPERLFFQEKLKLFRIRERALRIRMKSRRKDGLAAGVRLVSFNFETFEGSILAVIVSATLLRAVREKVQLYGEIIALCET